MDGVKIDRLSDEQRSKISAGDAEMLIDATAEFFDLFELDRAGLAAWICDQVRRGAFEYTVVDTATLEGEIVGIAVTCVEEQLAKLQAAATASLIRQVAASRRRDVLKSLANYSAQIAPIEPKAHSHYLSRIAVKSSARGRGVGRKLLEACLARYQGEGLSLHVQADNAAAIALYSRCGLQLTGSGHAFLLMRKDACAP